MPPRFYRRTNAAALAALLITIVSPVLGQANPPATPPAANPTAPSAPMLSAPAPSAPANPMNPANYPSAIEPLTGPIRAGDTVGVLVVGEAPLSGPSIVDSDGTITLPLAGQVKVQGMMPPKAAAEIARVLKEKKLLRNPQVTVAITARPVRTVLVSGALSRQDRQAIKEGARLSEVLEPAGILPTSDLTKVEITRGDKKVVVNYLKYRVGGEDSPAVNPVLQDGDRIFVSAAVSPAGVAGVFGEVKTPQQIAVTSGLTVGQALQQVGGVTELADRSGIFIERNGARIPVPYEEIVQGMTQKDIVLQDKDRVTIPSMEKPKVFTVTGAVNKAGDYPILPRTKVNLLEAVGRAGGPQDGARQNVIEVRRTVANGTVQTTKYNLERAEDAAVEIRPEDTIFVPYRRARQSLDIGTILGAISGAWFLLGR